MARNIVAVIVGLTAAGMTIWSIEMVNYRMFPLPDGLDITNKEAMKEYIKTLPGLAFGIVIFAHLAGAFIGGWIASLIAQNNQRNIALGIGLFLLVMGLINLLMIPHPIWFMILDLAVYVPAAFLGYKFFARRKN